MTGKGNGSQKERKIEREKGAKTEKERQQTDECDEERQKQTEI